jgi:hypothetical protein
MHSSRRETCHAVLSGSGGVLAKMKSAFIKMAGNVPMVNHPNV